MSEKQAVEIPSEYWRRGARVVAEATRDYPEFGIRQGDFLFRPPRTARSTRGALVFCSMGSRADLRRLRDLRDEPAALEIHGVVLGRAGELS